MRTISKTEPLKESDVDLIRYYGKELMVGLQRESKREESIVKQLLRESLEYKTEII